MTLKTDLAPSPSLLPALLRRREQFAGQPQRWAFVGTGMMGREHMRCALWLKQVEIAGFYEPHEESAAGAQRLLAAQGLESVQRFSSLEALAKDPTLDAVIIATPNYTHRAVFDVLGPTRKALLLEKPMATCLEDAVAITRQAEARHGAFQLGMQYRFKAQYWAALEALEAFGPVSLINMAEFRPPFLPKVGEWNKFERYSGGTLVEKCCHYFDLMQAFARSLPERIYASGGRAVNFQNFTYHGEAADIDDHAHVLIDYENGVRGQFTLAMFAQELHEELTVAGGQGLLRTRERASFRPGRRSEAALQVETPAHPLFDGTPLAYPDEIEALGHYGATVFAQDAFLQKVRGAPSPAATAREGLWAVVTASLAQRAMALGEPINVTATLKALGLPLDDLKPEWEPR